MGVATTYNPGANFAAPASMSRFNAILLAAFVLQQPPAFSQEDIDPATGLSRSTVVKPLRDAVPLPDARPMPPPVQKRPHVALILPTASPTLGRLADAVRQGFMAAAEVGARESPPVHVSAIENEGQALVDACRHAQSTGALVVVGGLTRDGAHALATSDCLRQPVLALNELRGPAPPTVFSVSLSLEHEARQVALQAVADGWRSAIIVHTATPLSRRVHEAFEREWIRAAGEVRRVPFSGKEEDAPLVRERIAATRGDMVFFALESAEARAVRPYVSGMLPLYATSLSVNPRADAIVNVDLQGVRYVEMPWFLQPDHLAVMAYPQAKGSMTVEEERLYAFGIDAFRLALAVVKGEAPKAPVDGVTGRLSLEGNHFSRVLPAAEVDGGRIIPLRP
jgi:outer membrane PBP1 activator LpoA protein